MSTDGWRCPSCSRCFSPAVTMCPFCVPVATVTLGGLSWVNLTCVGCCKPTLTTIDGYCPDCYGRPPK